MNAATKWILAIVGLLAGNILAMVILATSAHGRDAQIIPDYYARAATYDQQMADSARSRALGWTADARLVAGNVEVSVRDAGGRALDAAKVRVAGYQRAHLAQGFDLPLAPIGGGTYRAPVTSGQGVHDLTIIVERDGTRFVETAVVEAK